MSTNRVIHTTPANRHESDEHVQVTLEQKNGQIYVNGQLALMSMALCFRLKSGGESFLVLPHHCTSMPIRQLYGHMKGKRNGHGSGNRIEKERNESRI